MALSRHIGYQMNTPDTIASRFADSIRTQRSLPNEFYTSLKEVLDYLYEKDLLPRLLRGDNKRGAKPYKTVSGMTNSIVPHKDGAMLILLNSGSIEKCATWVSVMPSDLRDPVVLAWIQNYSVRKIDPEAEIEKFISRQEAGEIGTTAGEIG